MNLMLSYCSSRLLPFRVRYTVFKIRSRFDQPRMVYSRLRVAGKRDASGPTVPSTAASRRGVTCALETTSSEGDDGCPKDAALVLRFPVL